MGGEEGPVIRPRLSVVLPVLDEEETVDALLDALLPVLQDIGTYEVIFVDDGSRDSSADLVLARRSTDPSIKLVQLSRNFGHQAASPPASITRSVRRSS